MVKSAGTDARVCSRCFAREDAMRGVSPYCMSCGQPFPIAVHAMHSSQGHGASARGGESSTVLWWVLGGIGAFLVLGAIAGALLLVGAARGNSKESAPIASAPSADPVEVPLPIPVPSASTSPLVPPSIDVPTVASAAPIAATSKPQTPVDLDELAGNYTCSMDDTPAFPCRIANDVLEKLGGSQRFRGPIQKLPGGNFAFSGLFFCPLGACDHRVSTTFVRQAPGRYVGKFGPNSIPGGGPGNERVVLTKVSGLK